MTGPAASDAASFVPYRHRVEPVRRISPVQPVQQEPPGPDARRRQGGTRTEQPGTTPPPRHSAATAAPGWAAHLLFEAGMAGEDPARASRARRAYGSAATAGRVIAQA